MLTAWLLIVSALATLATSQSSVLYFTRVPNPMIVGEPNTILYTTNDTASPIFLQVYRGPWDSRQAIVTFRMTDGELTWTPADDTPNGNDYNLKISQAEQMNFFGPFWMLGPSSSANELSGTVSTSTASATSTRATDGASTLTTSASDASSTTAAASSSTSVEDASSQTLASEQSDTSLNTGAAAGLGVGATLAAVGLIVFGLWIFRRRRRKSTKVSRGSEVQGDGATVPALFPKAEKDGTERFEAPDTGHVPEADGNARSELEGNDLVS